ncbi:MAG: hypothetical protein M4579_007215 [Chaenotheca gracillima]|nr:MAG: hypothetical protein M4579_007215 [Chaenotheca gracillima]
MHELLLFGQVTADRQDQVLKILAGLAGMQPERVVRRHLVFKPTISPNTRNTQIGASQGIQNRQMQSLQGQLQGELFYLQLVRDVDEDWVSPSHESSKAPNQTGVNGSSGYEASSVFRSSGAQGPPEEDDAKSHSWSVRFNDLPEVAGRRPVTSRMISIIDVSDGDPIAFMNKFGYNLISEYVLEGHRFAHKNMNLLLHRILRFPADSGSGQSDKSGGLKAPWKSLPPYNSFSPLDPSNALVLEASIRIQDGNKPETMTLGMGELKAFRDAMKGVVEMEVGDRLALDTRVR